MHTGNVIVEDVNMLARESLLRTWLSALVCAVLLAACGDSDDEVPDVDTVYKKKESKTLAKHGTAATEEDEKAREADKLARRKRNEAIVKLTGLMTKVEEASGDAFDLAEALAAVIEYADYAQDYEAEIAKHLDHADPDVRISALRVISRMKRAGAKEELTKALADDEDHVRAAAMRLWRLAGITDLAPAFAALDDLATDVQLEAVKTITAGTVGDAGRKVLVQKAEMLEGPPARVVLEWAVENKDKLGGDLGGLLIRMLDHPDDKVRLEAVRAVRTVAAKRESVALKLVQLLRNDPDPITTKAAHALLAEWAGAAAPGFDPGADTAARVAASEKWREWVAGAGLSN